MMSYLNEEKGFTLIESMVAMVVLIIGITTLYNMQAGATRGNTSAWRNTAATSQGADRLEQVMSQDYVDVASGVDPNGQWTVTVTDNQPLERMKTVRVRTSSSYYGAVRNVDLTYYKQDY